MTYVIKQSDDRERRIDKTYCRSCGSLMKLKPELSQYEEETGEKLFALRWICPLPFYNKIFSFHPNRYIGEFKLDTIKRIVKHFESKKNDK